jgi:septal ring factor EnvC (AmiA/AmiB activator)
MRHQRILCLLFLAAPAFVAGQKHFEQQEQLSYEARVTQIEGRLAARSEDVKQSLKDISDLQNELRTVREQAKSAEDLSKANADRIDQITWVGRTILGAVAFIIGVMVTQLVSRFMTARKPRVVMSKS